MERNLYFENYLTNIQKDVFLIAYDKNYDMVDFINIYMKSDIRKDMDQQYSYWHFQNPHRIVEEIITTNKIKQVNKQIINKDIIEWLGYFYSKWHFQKGDASKKIVSFFPVKEALKDFFELHQIDEIEAIDITKCRYNIRRNAHRDNEFKKYKPQNLTFYNPKYYSYYAARIIYKLTKEQIYKNLDIKWDNEYDFVDKNREVGITAKVLNRNDKLSIFDIYTQAELESKQYPSEANKSIFFLFIQSKIYLENISLLLKHINELKEKYKPIHRHFKYLYICVENKVYEINHINELYKYSVTFSKRENDAILAKLEKLDLI